MKQELISIIVPVYNVEQYMDECIESIVGQSYKNLEIVLVDDGSADSSGEKCDEWQKKDQRIRVIHQKNAGLSEARNAGMGAASGSCIGFVDSDDVIHPQMIQALYEKMQEQNCEIACCQVERAVQFRQFLRRDVKKCGTKVYGPEEAILAVMLDREVYPVAWNKLYRREMIRRMKFPAGKCHEDEFWTYRALANAGRTAVLDVPLYGYRQRADSIMNAGYSLKRLDLLEARAQRLIFLEERFPGLLPTARCDFRFECIRAMQFCLLFMEGQEFQTAEKMILDYVKSHPLRYRDYRDLPFGRKVWCFLSGITFSGTCRLRNGFHFGP